MPHVGLDLQTVHGHDTGALESPLDLALLPTATVLGKANAVETEIASLSYQVLRDETAVATAAGRMDV